MASAPLRLSDLEIIISDESILSVYRHEGTAANGSQDWFELRTMPNAFGEVTVLIRYNGREGTSTYGQGTARLLTFKGLPKTSDRTETTN
ncbi:MAG: hypothetical protein K2K53_01430, partial [Oscillospiraceae bacterium]|nr:hypothetical protein [Oscillospiraceae bacterium]